MGVDPLPGEVSGHDLPTLTQAIRAVSTDWQSGRIQVPKPAAEPRAKAPGTVPAADARPDEISARPTEASGVHASGVQASVAELPAPSHSGRRAEAVRTERLSALQPR